MSGWLLSIVGVVFLGVLFDLIYPNGKTNSLCKTIFALVAVVVGLGSVGLVLDPSTVFELKPDCNGFHHPLDCYARIPCMLRYIVAIVWKIAKSHPCYDKSGPAFAYPFQSLIPIRIVPWLLVPSVASRVHLPN